MIGSGERNKHVTLENPSSVPDGEGGMTESWAVLDPPTMWAHIAPASQADLERAAGGTILSTASHLVEMLFHPGVTIKTRLRYTPPGRSERIFQVTSVRNPDEADRELVLVAEEQL